MKKLLAVCAALFFGIAVLHAQVLLNVDITSPNTMVITATGTSPVTSDSSHTFLDGVDLEGLFTISDGSTADLTLVSSTLTTGDSSSGPLYNMVDTDSASEPSADLNLYNNGSDLYSTESFTYGLPAFQLGTSLTFTFSGLTFSGIDYGVIVAGYVGNPDTEGIVSDSEVSTGATVPIGVYHVTSVAAPEPSTYALMLGGLVLLGFCVRRKLA